VQVVIQFRAAAGRIMVWFQVVTKLKEPGLSLYLRE